MSQLQIVATLGAAALLLMVLELVRRRRLLERYALLWLAVGLVLVVLGAWRGLLTTISDAIGVAAPPNALFAVGLGFLVILVLNFSVVISRLSDQTKVLAQRLGLLEERLRASEAALRELREGAGDEAERDVDAPVS
jgi:hypothetical protein